MRRVGLGLKTDPPTPAAPRCRPPLSESGAGSPHSALSRVLSKPSYTFWTLEGLPTSWEANYHPLKRTRAAPYSRSSRERALEAHQRIPCFTTKHGRPAHDDADAAAHGRLGNCGARNSSAGTNPKTLRHRGPAARRPDHQPRSAQAPDVVPVGLSRLAAPRARRARRRAEPRVLLEPVAAVAAAGPRVADAPQPAAAATFSRRPRGLLEPALWSAFAPAVAPLVHSSTDTTAVVAARPRAMILAPRN